MGSSPLTQGKQLAHLEQGVFAGLIPTHTGKTSSFSWLLRRSAAHPRSREENEKYTVKGVRQMGSSPLTRGKRFTGCESLDSFGPIPTHAGKTPSRGCPRRIGTAHPHSRGENTSPAGATGLSQGSSPLTRGKHGLRASVRENAGLIPAHAGKTFPLSSCARSGGAHPHSRGENAGTTQRPPPLSGSSPLTRGVLHGCRDRDPRVGLIPTHAGKTLRRR